MRRGGRAAITSVAALTGAVTGSMIVASAPPSAGAPGELAAPGGAAGGETGITMAETTERTAEVSLREILLAQIARYPAMEIADLYKLLHQAVFGSEHAVRDPEAARARLAAEIAGLGEAAERGSEPVPALEPAIDPISPDGQIVRVHLRPFLAEGGSVEALLEAFLRTAAERGGSKEDFLRSWSVAESLAAEGRLPCSPDSLRAFGEFLSARGLPAIHHSEAYARFYAPAYRVVRRSLLQP